MNQLIKKYSDRPMRFFPESAFYKEQILGYVMDVYENIIKEFDSPVVSLGELSYNQTLYFLGVYSRMCELDEIYEINLPLFYTTEQFNDSVRELYEMCNGDYFKMLEYGITGASINPKYQAMLRHDIALVLDMYKVFFIHSEVPYDSLPWFYKELEKDGIAGHPFAEGNVDKLFKNAPVKSVW